LALKPVWRGKEGEEKNLASTRNRNPDFVVVQRSFVKIRVFGAKLGKSVVLVRDVE
jgi:hypothetical protein